MGAFGVSAWDINVNTKLADLKVSNLHYSVRINDAGEFGYDINLSDQSARQAAQVLMSLEGTPYKTLITTNTGTSILYSGITWQSSMKSGSPRITFAGKGLMSYFSQVVIADSYTTSINPLQLIADAVTDAQNSGSGADRGIRPVIPTYGSIPNVTPSYNVNQYTTVAQIVSDQTAGITPGTGGVDYYMSDSFVNGSPRHQLVLNTPRSGRDQTQSGLSVNLQKAISWDWATEATTSGNHVIVVGSGTGGAQPVATADAPVPRGGLGQAPRLDAVLQYSQVANQSQLQTIANGSAQRYGKPISTPVVTVPANYKPCMLGSFQIGDDIRLWSGPSIWFPRGYSQWWRIVAYTVTIPDAGLPTVALTLNPPPVF